MRKTLLTLLTAITMLSLASCGNSAKTAYSAEGYIGTHYEEVIAELKDAGFINIEAIEVADLTSSSDLQDGAVGEISIDGNDNFAEKTEFPKDAQVSITYHIIKKLAVPLSSDEIQEYDYETIATMFSETGFANVAVEEVLDLDPDITEVKFENEVIINGISYFDEIGAIPFDASISIICHRPYEKHIAKIHIDFIPNLIFSKYDVCVLLDGVEQHTIKHGEDKDFEFSLKDGTYTLSFVSTESSSVKGDVSLEIDCDVHASFKISCSSDSVNVETTYIDRDKELNEDEAKVMSDKSGFANKNYVAAINTLREWGFTNIQSTPLYDISFGWTEEGSVENVTINGTDDYTRGDVYKKDVEIIVTYHLNEDDDPSKIKPPYDTDTADGVDYRDVVTAFENAGFTNISTNPRFEAAFWGYEADTVANIYINENGTFDTTDAFAPDAEVRIDYYVISDSDSKSDIELTSFYAKKAFEEYGELLYPFGFKCHWIMDLRNMEQYDDGSWFIKVGVTIENAYGNEIETVAEGMVSGTDKNPQVTDFYVSN